VTIMRDLTPISELSAKSAPFQDANCKLSVLDVLRAKQILKFGTFTDFLKFIEGSDYNYEQSGYRLSKKAYDYLIRYPLTDQQIRAVTELYFDGGLEIYRYAYPFWSGETDEFDIHSLDGISLLPNLTTFGFSAMLTSTDLSPLANHANLGGVELGLTRTWLNFEVLESSPKLSYLQVCGHDLNDASEASIARLSRRGVKVNVF